jgi:hypothetical protein
MSMKHLLGAGAVLALWLISAAPASADGNCPAGSKAEGARVQLWTEPECKGTTVIVPFPGNGNRDNFRTFEISSGIVNVDNTLTSLALAPSTCVRFFDDVGYRGDASELICSDGTTSYPGLGPFADRASSMRVCRSNVQSDCARDGGASGPPPSTPPPGSNSGSGDAFRSDPARGCRSQVQPGALALRAWLRANHRGRATTPRSCPRLRRTRLRLRHEGRAVEFRVSSIADGDAVVRAFAADNWSLARRMGLQEVAFNGQIWTASRASLGLRSFQPGSYRDRVVIGMNWAGARMQTSFWKS